MNTATRLLWGTADSLGLSLGALGVTPALAQSDQPVTVDRAGFVVNDLRHDKAFGTARDLMHRARAVMIVPRLYKGASSSRARAAPGCC